MEFCQEVTYHLWHFPDMAFNLPFFYKNTRLQFYCVLSPELHKTQWIFDLPRQGISGTTLPDCLYVCPSHPKQPGKGQTREWSYGSVVIGTKATYTCQSRDLVMKTTQIYHSIEVTCALNSSTNQSQWYWLDGSTLSTDIPPCEVRILINNKNTLYFIFLSV